VIRFSWSRFGTLIAALALSGAAGATELASTASEWVISRALVLDNGTKFGRNTLFTDAVESRLAAGTWRLPQEGESWTLPSGGQRSWTNAVADASGWFEGPAMRGGWALMTIEVAEPRIVVLNASGQTMSYVNGEPRAGDLYQYGYVETPILLHKGTNELLFATGRGRLRVRLRAPRSPMEITAGDRTTPDLLSNESVDTHAAVVLINSTTNWARNLALEAVWSRWSTRTPVPAIPPLGVFKAGFQVTGQGKPDGESAPVELRLLAGNEAVDTQTIALRVRKPEQTFKRTFVSEIDDSVQYFAVQPSSTRGNVQHSALFLSFHGASVEGLSQAEAYAPKSWGTVVSPTNRRPYAFDWEDWSRLDALEVLELARREFNPDPSRIYLTGHSMGGHGTWNFGATFPDQFAAIGPSAGWISFFSYGGSDPLTNATPVEAILRRSAASSDTLLMATNYLHQGIYIIHGDADDNVPMSEANRMREVLGTFHRDVDGHNEPGAGHWWDKSDEPGADCVDWAPMFDFFARHRIPSDSEVRRVRFVTVNPGVSSRSHWAAIESQEKALGPSEIDLQWEPGQRRVTGSTRNVARLALETDGWGEKLTVQLDGQTLTNLEPSMATVRSSAQIVPGAPREWHRPLWLEKAGRQWRLSMPDSAVQKNPRRNGPFKEAFRHHLVLVYGTHGTPEENAWALAKARFDSEAFWYRGNGSLTVISDDEFTLTAYPDRGVVLYGHREMNSAWPLLLSQSPVQIGRNMATVGGRTLNREDLGGLFIQPRRDSDIACVAVVAGSGIEGMRLLNRLPYFMAGPGYPDCLIVGREFLQKGNAGIVTAGFFGNDWSVDHGDFEWSKSEP
jgi:poly(3-hydroxybutyrate) depolymerase